MSHLFDVVDGLASVVSSSDTRHWVNRLACQLLPTLI